MACLKFSGLLSKRTYRSILLWYPPALFGIVRLKLQILYINHTAIYLVINKNKLCIFLRLKWASQNWTWAIFCWEKKKKNKQNKKQGQVLISM